MDNNAPEAVVDYRQRIFVGNLPYSMNEDQLKALFIEQAGFKEDDIADVIILKERSPEGTTHPSRSKGTGFVAFASAELAARALAGETLEASYEMKGEVLKRPIFLNPARPPKTFQS